MPIYTKKGDTGKTSLFNGTRVFKDNARVDTYGTIDELNSQIGVVIAHFTNQPYEQNLKRMLLQIQDDLLNIGSFLADPTGIMSQNYAEHLQKEVKVFETAIDTMTEEMPPIRNFILPGGGKVGSFLQMTRTIARRAERRLVTLLQKETVEQTIIMYFNRLSDLFFTMSRYVNYKEGNQDSIWHKYTG